MGWEIFVKVALLHAVLSYLWDLGSWGDYSGYGSSSRPCEIGEVKMVFSPLF